MNTRTILVAGFFVASLSSTACMTSAPAPESTASTMPLVSSVRLSRTVGHVGEKFKADIALHARRMGETEVKVRSLPPGLHFDRESMTIKGVPKADGFFSVTVAVRKKRGKGIHFNTPQGAWYSERLDIDIYRPLEDSAARDKWADDDRDVAVSSF